MILGDSNYALQLSTICPVVFAMSFTIQKAMEDDILSALPAFCLQRMEIAGQQSEALCSCLGQTEL